MGLLVQKIIWFCLLAWGLCSQNIWAQELLLAAGEQRSISVELGSKFSVGNPEVLQVKPTQIQNGQSVLLVKAKHLGYSDLIIIAPNGAEKQIAFRVGSKKESGLGQDIKNVLTKTSGLEIKPQGNQLLVQGEVKRLADYNALQVLAKKNNMADLTRLHPLPRRLAEAEIQKNLLEAGIHSIHVKGAASQVWLEGLVESQAQKDLAEAIAKEVFPSVKSFLRVPFSVEEILRFKVRILEISKTKHDSMGFQWSEMIPGILQLHQQLLKGSISLDASLALLAHRGLVKILSEPEITVNEEGVAELKVGGEIPIPLRSRYFSQIQWKPYGLQLRIEVPGVNHDLVRTKINVDVSTLDHSNAADGVPAVKSNSMQTVVDLTLSKTIFLSGLIQENIGESVSSFPLLGDIPILGELFRSKDFQQNKSELVIAVTPLRE